MSEQELKPCPFCGGDAEIERHGTPKQSAIVTCTQCGCTLESNEQGAGHFWNERQASAERYQAEIKALREFAERVIEVAVDENDSILVEFSASLGLWDCENDKPTSRQAY